MNTIIIQGLKGVRFITQGYLPLVYPWRYLLRLLPRRYKLEALNPTYTLAALPRRYKLEAL